MATGGSGRDFIDDEIQYVKRGDAAKNCPEAELITCHRALVRYHIRLTEFKQVAVNFQFPSGYPAESIVLEIKSKTIPEKFLSNLVKVCEENLKQYREEQQIRPSLEFVVQFLKDHPFVVCPEELSHVKKDLYREGDELRVKQKAGSIVYRAAEGGYFVNFQLTIPQNYPASQVSVLLKESNFPPEFVQVFTGLAVDLARRCVEPPVLKKKGAPPFVPSPSLQKVADFIVTDCVRRYPKEVCPLCNERALPEDPADVVKDEKHDKYVVRVYCGHLYHCGCLDPYMKTPPFQGGKKCLSCKERIFHDRWKTSPKVLEERWAHQEAKKRELQEVSDFLGL
jgi:hypothetical protein